MSEPTEKEGALSILVSASSAWSALGAGLSLMVLAFFAILLVVVQSTTNQTLDNALRDKLGSDLASSKRSNVTLGTEGKSLELLVSSAESGSLESVIYSWEPQSGVLLRLSSVEPKKQELGKADFFKFGTTKNSLVVRMKLGATTQRKSWALNRWCLP